MNSMKISLWILLFFVGAPLLADDVYFVFKEGKKAWYGKRYEEAIVYFEQIVSRFPQSHYYDKSLYFLGQAYFKAKKYEEAIKTLEHYRSSCPDCPQIDAQKTAILSAIALFQENHKEKHRQLLLGYLATAPTPLSLLAAKPLLERGDDEAGKGLLKRAVETENRRFRQEVYEALITYQFSAQAQQLKGRLREAVEPSPPPEPRFQTLTIAISRQGEHAVQLVLPLTLVDYLPQTVDPPFQGLIEESLKPTGSLRHWLSGTMESPIILRFEDKGQEILLTLSVQP